MTATRSFYDLLSVKGWSPPAKRAVAAKQISTPTQPTALKKKATSMLELFAHRPSRSRSSSCTVDEDISSSLASSSSSTIQATHQQRQRTAHAKTNQLKKCSSAGATSSKTLNGWGMVPVLNELAQHSSFYHSPTRTRRASQCVCRNCERLFFRHLSAVADFCSLDCQASHAYHHDVQDVIDTQLKLGDSGESNWSHASSCSSLVSLSPGS